MKRRLTRTIKTKCLESEVEGLRIELAQIKGRQVEQIAKLVDEQAIRNAEAYRQALKNAIAKFEKIAILITSCPSDSSLNTISIVAMAGVIEAKSLLEL